MRSSRFAVRLVSSVLMVSLWSVVVPAQTLGTSDSLKRLQGFSKQRLKQVAKDQKDAQREWSRTPPRPELTKSLRDQIVVQIGVEKALLQRVVSIMANERGWGGPADIRLFLATLKDDVVRDKNYMDSVQRDELVAGGRLALASGDSAQARSLDDLRAAVKGYARLKEVMTAKKASVDQTLLGFGQPSSDAVYATYLEQQGRQLAIERARRTREQERFEIGTALLAAFGVIYFASMTLQTAEIMRLKEEFAAKCRQNGGTPYDTGLWSVPQCL